MKIRTLIIATALVSSALGGVAVYLALTVPNDLRADTLLKDARQQLTAGNERAATDKLKQVLQQYPRTNAAAAATVALVAISESQRNKLERKVAAIEKQNEKQQAQFTSLQNSVKALANRPPPPPPPAPAVKPAAAKPPVRKVAPKRTTTRKAPTKRTTTRKRRR